MKSFITSHQNINGWNSQCGRAMGKLCGDLKGLVAISISELRKGQFPKNFGDFQFCIATEDVKYKNRVGVFVNKKYCRKIEVLGLPDPKDFDIRNSPMNLQYKYRIHAIKFNLSSKFVVQTPLIVISVHAPVTTKTAENKREKEDFMKYLTSLIDHLRGLYPGSNIIAQGDYNCNPIRVTKLSDPTSYKMICNGLWNKGMDNHNYRYGLGIDKSSSEYKSKVGEFSRFGVAKKTVYVKKGDPFKGGIAEKGQFVTYYTPSVSWLDFAYSDFKVINGERNSLNFFPFGDNSYQNDINSDHVMEGGFYRKGFFYSF